MRTRANDSVVCAAPPLALRVIAAGGRIMAPAPMSVQRLFDEVSARLLRDDPDVELAHMFNSDGLRTRANGRFFATVSGDRLLVKLPAGRVAELVAGGDGQPFHSGGRLMREWVLLQPADGPACAASVDEAHRFVAAQRARR